MRYNFAWKHFKKFLKTLENMTTFLKLSKIIFQCSVKTRELVYAGSFCLRLLWNWGADTQKPPAFDSLDTHPRFRLKSANYLETISSIRKVLIRFGNPLGGKKHGNYMVCNDLKRFLSTKLQQQLCNQIKTAIKLKKLSELLVICKSQRQNPFLSWRKEKKSTMIIIIIIIIPKSFWLIVLLNLAYELLYCTSFNEKNNIFFCHKSP